MCVDRHINETFSEKRGIEAYAKSIDPGQPAQSAQADLGRYFLILINFPHIKRTFLLKIHFVFRLKVDRVTRKCA